MDDEPAAVGPVTAVTARRVGLLPAAVARQWVDAQIHDLQTSRQWQVSAAIPVLPPRSPAGGTPDGATALVVASFANLLTVIETRTNQVTTTLPVGELPKQVAVAPDGRHAYVTDSSSGTVTVVDL
ncbi:YncE family protein [Streptomyces sp. NPDC002888]|uniref:YncE family protein n=1 Tax=Streptomyces sp. NPDC002888 TaxID=3364668 RepID=UPI00368FC95A